jgi:hypothetical protein
MLPLMSGISLTGRERADTKQQEINSNSKTSLAPAVNVQKTGLKTTFFMAYCVAEGSRDLPMKVRILRE